LQKACLRVRCAQSRENICTEGYVKSEREIRSQLAAVRERVQELSGFWIGEAAAMIYALEWVLEKRAASPAGELGRAGSDSEKIAGNLAKLVEKAAAAPKPLRERRQKANPPRRRRKV
jgi:hypothetical protein